MKATGFNFQKGRIRLVTLEWQNDKPAFVSRKLVDIDPELPLTELADRYVAHLRGLFDEVASDLIAVRQVYESDSLDASTTQIMPLGLLAFICHEKNLPLVAYTPPSLRSGKAFGLEKSQKPMEHVDAIFGEHPPYWDGVH
ncbi:hypothetical protein [Bradyrhizobium sp.]|uniref:hypothetical protein n=1 Tax=Bradyrhizobium sp. TaxID=376 RepID=UPI001EC2C8E7|nr:hypothetical protein [Bradyrhizobium sp.]MBV8923010.1 hypothetical protein [Bradyrhizobium sp.]MBV9983692.1 hypothetical protein [Bradyrhizobium sp.]